VDPRPDAGPTTTATAAPDSPDSPGSSGRSRASATPRPTAALPATPSLADPAALADQLTGALDTVAEPGAAEDGVRRAALFEQLSSRLLAEVPTAAADRVLGRLRGAARAQAVADVTAARELLALTAPQPKLPPWRIVTPPPAAELLRHYRRAERATGVPWEYLAAIHLVETRMGRIRGTSAAGAQGPMQFLPSTFAQYGAGGDINDPGDAILAAGRMLRADGAPEDLGGALYAYNHSSHYVRAVTAYATRMARSPAAYDIYWHWQVVYRQVDRLWLLPEGYPRVRARVVALG